MTGLVITLVLLNAGFVAYRAWVAPYRRRAPRRALMRIPETPIAGVKDGERVRIKGRAIAREPLRTSPISRRPCIGFRLIVQSDSGGRDVWQRVVDQEQFDSFLLLDDTGEAMLHAPFDLELDPYDVRSDNPSPVLLEILEREGVPVRGTFGIEHRFRYVETILMPGDEITAVGRATLEIDAAGRPLSHRHPPVMCHLRGIDEAVVIADADDLAP